MVSPAERLRDLMEEIALADQSVSTSSASASITGRISWSPRRPSCSPRPRCARKRIRLTSAVTVLSSDDPVRVFQEFATLDLLSGGRAEIMAGRGSFIESFPLFGYDLDDYDELFAEKLELLLKIRESEHVTWTGGIARRSMTRASIPVRFRTRCRSGSPSAARRSRPSRAGMLGLPMALAIIGGEPERFVPLVELYRDAARKAGHDPRAAAGRHQLPWLRRRHVAEGGRTSSTRPIAESMNRIGRERG